MGLFINLKIISMNLFREPILNVVNIPNCCAIITYCYLGIVSHPD